MKTERLILISMCVLSLFLISCAISVNTGEGTVKMVLNSAGAVGIDGGQASDGGTSVAANPSEPQGLKDIPASQPADTSQSEPPQEPDGE